MRQLQPDLKNPAGTLRFVYALCLAGATWNHARILHAHGLHWDYGGVAPFYAAFWTPLTFVDALAVLLLLTSPRAGLVLTTAIIVCDVLVNASAGLAYRLDMAAFSAQCVFLVFVVATVRYAWPSATVRACA